jgi:exonuclease SbcC
MIPQRIRLKGFLCYKDEQEISFDSNATLWMLSGLNGSGKSSIFDATTYALFGHHRGGSQHAVELINKDSDGLIVEFDFRLDERVYRVRRTLRRKSRGSPSSTQQIYRYENGNGKPSWVAVEGTNYKREFDNWVGEKIGLTYETFTSSVLLLQGKADKLLDSNPEGRRKVLASIVDLERYENLHALADEKRRELKGKLESLSDRLGATPEVKAEQVAEAEETIRIAEEARIQAGAEVEKLRERESQAREWVALQGKLASARERWQRARQVLDSAAAIDQDVRRLRDLRAVLPRLSEIANHRTEIHKAQVRMEALTKERQKAEELLEERNIALTQAQGKRDSIQKLLDAEIDKLQAASNQLGEAGKLLDRVKQYDSQEAKLREVREQLKSFSPDPQQDVTRAKEACDRLGEVGRVAPLLERFRGQRDGLREAMEREASAQRNLDDIKARGNEYKAEVERLAPLVEEAKLKLQQASDQAAEARTLVQQARESLKEATHLEGAAACRHCGQQLRPGHIEDEKRKRTALVHQAEGREKQAKEVHRIAREAEKKLREEHDKAKENRQDARVKYEEARGQLKEAKQKIDGFRSECARIYGELPSEYRTKIGMSFPEDWLATTYPLADDLNALHAEADQLPKAVAQLNQAEDALSAWNKLKAKESAHLEELLHLRKELPVDHLAVRANHTRLDLDVQAHTKTIQTHKTNLKTIKTDIEDLTLKRGEADQQLGDCKLKVREQEQTKEIAQNSMQKQMKALPPAWQPAAENVGLTEVYKWESEKSDLEAKGTDERERVLEQARHHLDDYRKDKEALEGEQEKVPVEARCEPAAIHIQLEEAKKVEKLREQELSGARRQLDLLHSFRKQREQIGEEYVRLEGEWNQHKTLAELLGKDRLQLYLVRQAERQVVEYANAVLDRLSGGQLYLKLSGEANGEGNSAKALDLEAYNRSTGEKPINVAFLSGSQKFRVAVSLALGIGQYASRQHRPIESVIIDEGFGCLDSQGRQVMIQELQNLRSQMRCILLVSHQEEFAEAFADGYHFELEAGATRVRRFQK